MFGINFTISAMKIRVGLILDLDLFQENLESFGYRRVPLVLTPGDYALRGSVLDIFPNKQNLPIRIELFDTEIEDIRSFEPSTQRSISSLRETEIVPFDKKHKLHDHHIIPHEILFDLNPGDKVVHIHHGVGEYKGLKRMKLQAFEGEYAMVEYDQGDMIYIPIEQLTRIYKYAGAVDPKVNSLRDNAWQKTQKRVRKAVQNVAKELFSLFKTRRLNPGFSFDEESELTIDLERSFPFAETEDQRKAIEAVNKDMESTRAMDRLVCGDVGFGKTEVALRAAFKAVLSKKQVAVLAPTTILTKQHFRVFSQRLTPLGVNVQFINRFKTRKEQLQTLQGVKSGIVDIIIGTHRLLQKDVDFADIGLLIIDEEQRFGVMAKEKIKQYRSSIDVLTLSATPLPRTLYLSISGIRDISVINTPPLKRLPIITEYLKFDIHQIRSKILFELKRKGQVFLLHNRIHDIYHLYNKLHVALPDVEMRIAHGQMKSGELDRLMSDFYDHKYSVLISTTIIENGIDIPNCHTIFVDDANQFGLAQLHQLRGRVGRDETQSYAYLIYKGDHILTDEVKARFEALKEFEALGAGYDIALRDLELRGIGNLLGTQQSGYMEAVGFEFYMHLLNEAISRERGQQVKKRPYLQISSKMQAYIPEDYIPDMNIRLALYKRIADLESTHQADQLRQECQDRFGALPENLHVMLTLIRDEIDHSISLFKKH